MLLCLQGKENNKLYFMINTSELWTLNREKHTLFDEYFTTYVVFFTQSRAIKNANNE